MMADERNKMRDELLNADAELHSALREFKMSMHAWSEAELSRPRTVKVTARTPVWRMAAGWAMGCVLVLGVGSAGVYEHEHRVATEHMQQAKLAEQQEAERKLAAQNAALDEDALLRHVDSDVARQVPAAMDPLAG